MGWYAGEVEAVKQLGGAGQGVGGVGVGAVGAVVGVGRLGEEM